MVFGTCILLCCLFFEKYFKENIFFLTCFNQYLIFFQGRFGIFLYVDQFINYLPLLSLGTFHKTSQKQPTGQFPKAHGEEAENQFISSISFCMEHNVSAGRRGWSLIYISIQENQYFTVSIHWKRLNSACIAYTIRMHKIEASLRNKKSRFQSSQG